MSHINMTPRHEHDHEDCTFLGQWVDDDLYWCDQGGFMPTLIARHSSRDSDYTSGRAFERDVPALAVAGERARARGLDVQHG